MKKILSVLTALTFLFTACGYACAADQYSIDFDFAMTALQLLTGSIDMVTKTNLAIWKEAGPEYVLDCIDQFDKFGNPDLEYPEPSTKNMKILEKVFGSYSATFEAAQVYHLVRNPLINIEQVKELIKTFKNNYPDHAGAAKALQDYYIKAAAYADIALNPTGSYISYTSDITTFQKEIKELKGNAEFEK